MKKTKRILAIIGVVLLVALYGSTLVFAIFDHTKSSAGTFVCIYTYSQTNQ